MSYKISKETVTKGKLPDVKFHLIPGSVWADLKSVKKSKSGKKSGDVWSENEMIEELRKYNGVFVNDAFIPLWNNFSQLVFLEGSYGSSKTTYAITRLLVKCMESPAGKFKCFYGRQQKEMARQLHSNIVREIVRNHWEDRFEYSTKPNGSKKIYCNSNGNMFELFGCDDLETLKGIDNPTDILVDEINQIDFSSFGMLVSRLRTSGAVLQLWGCFNPCDVYPAHWLVKYIYSKNGGESESEQIVLEALQDLSMISHHSVYTDNFFQNPDAYLSRLKLQAGGDEERLKDYTSGRWGTQLNAQPYYKQFKFERDVYPNEWDFGKKRGWTGVRAKDGQREILYSARLPLVFSFDENVQPYLPVILAQLHLVTEYVIKEDGTPELDSKGIQMERVWKEVHIIDEITAKNPDNSLYSVCPMIEEKYWDHKSGMDITGDATSRKEDAKLEKGQNFFTIAVGLLKRFQPELRISDANPNNKVRGNFINMIFKENIYNIRIMISKSCEKMIEDLQNTMEELTNDKGIRTGKKDKSTSIVDGVRKVQQYGHLCDCLDYLICELCMEEYLLFQNDGMSYDPSGGKRTVMNSIRNGVFTGKNYDDEHREKNRRSGKLDFEVIENRRRSLNRIR